jgi:hypothetical protein
MENLINPNSSSMANKEAIKDFDNEIEQKTEITLNGITFISEGDYVTIRAFGKEALFYPENVQELFMFFRKIPFDRWR